MGLLASALTASAAFISASSAAIQADDSNIDTVTFAPAECQDINTVYVTSTDENGNSQLLSTINEAGEINIPCMALYYETQLENQRTLIEAEIIAQALREEAMNPEGLGTRMHDLVRQGVAGDYGQSAQENARMAWEMAGYTINSIETPDPVQVECFVDSLGTNTVRTICRRATTPAPY